MRRSLAILTLILPLAAAPLRAQSGPTDALRAQFKPYEQWMLDVVLSDPGKKATFDVDAVAAQKGGDDRTRVMMKWRKTLVSFAEYYKHHLDTTDILPNAPSVEKMVTPEEFNITQYYWLRKPAAERQSFLSDVANGDKILNWGGRGLVEGRVRKGRQTFSGDLGQYINDPDSKAAETYVPPQPKPAVVDAPPPAAPAAKPGAKTPPKKPVAGSKKPANPDGARNQLDNIANNSTPGGTDESASERTGQGFTGSGSHGAPPVSPTDAPAPPVSDAPPPPPPAGALSGLSPSAGGFQGGFVVKPPPQPVLDREKTAQGGSTLKAAIVKYGPTVAGGLLGAILGAVVGFLVGGPLGAVIGGGLAAAGGALGGYLLGKKLFS